MRISDWSSDVCSSDLLHHQVEILHRHLGKALVAQDAGVVDQDVDAAPFLLRLGDHLGHMLIFSDAAAVRHGGAARRADFLDDLQRRIRMAGAVARAAQVVHNDLPPAPRPFEQSGRGSRGERVGSYVMTYASAGTLTK